MILLIFEVRFLQILSFRSKNVKDYYVIITKFRLARLQLPDGFAKAT